MPSVSKKRQRTTPASPIRPLSNDSDSETSDSDVEWGASGKRKKIKKKKSKASSGKPQRKPSSDNEISSASDPEEGTEQSIIVFPLIFSIDQLLFVLF